VSVYVG